MKNTEEQLRTFVATNKEIQANLTPAEQDELLQDLLEMRRVRVKDPSFLKEEETVFLLLLGDSTVDNDGWNSEIGPLGLAFPNDRGIPYDLSANIHRLLKKAGVKTAVINLAIDAATSSNIYTSTPYNLAFGGDCNTVSHPKGKRSVQTEDAKTLLKTLPPNSKKILALSFCGNDFRGEFLGYLTNKINSREISLSKHVLGNEKLDLKIKQEMQALLQEIIDKAIRNYQKVIAELLTDHPDTEVLLSTQYIPGKAFFDYPYQIFTAFDLIAKAHGNKPGYENADLALATTLQQVNKRLRETINAECLFYRQNRDLVQKLKGKNTWIHPGKFNNAAKRIIRPSGEDTKKSLKPEQQQRQDYLTEILNGKYRSEQPLRDEDKITTDELIAEQKELLATRAAQIIAETTIEDTEDNKNKIIYCILLRNPYLCQQINPLDYHHATAEQAAISMLDMTSSMPYKDNNHNVCQIELNRAGCQEAGKLYADAVEDLSKGESGRYYCRNSHGKVISEPLIIEGKNSSDTKKQNNAQFAVRSRNYDSLCATIKASLQSKLKNAETPIEQLLKEEQDNVLIDYIQERLIKDPKAEQKVYRRDNLFKGYVNYVTSKMGFHYCAADKVDAALQFGHLYAVTEEKGRNTMIENFLKKNAAAAQKGSKLNQAIKKLKTTG